MAYCGLLRPIASVRILGSTGSVGARDTSERRRSRSTTHRLERRTVGRFAYGNGRLGGDACVRETRCVRRDRDFWRQLIAEIEHGDRIADVARRHRVQPKTLTWWRWKLRSTRSTTVDARFLPVVVKQAGARLDSFIELRVRDVTVRVVGGTDVGYVAALVDALRG